MPTFAYGAYGTIAYGTGPYGAEGTEPPTGETGPHTAVEVAFTTDPGAAIPAWVDLGDFDSASTQRGRSRELDRFTAGRATVVLPNEDRRFDPTHTASPHYPNVVPMRRARLRATLDGVTYPVLTGYADGWDQSYRHPGDAKCTLTFTDAFKVLAGIELPPSAYAAEARADVPAAWWRLGDATGTKLRDSVLGQTIDVISGVEFGQLSLVDRDPDTAIKLSAPTGWAKGPLATTVVTGPPLTMELIWQSTVPSPTGFVLATLSDFVDVAVKGSVAFQVGTTEFFVGVSSVGAGTTFAEVHGTTNIVDGSPHHLAVTWAADGTVTLYVDGVAEGGTAYVTPAVWAANAVHIGNIASAMEGTYDEFAVYASALPAARVLAHAQARATAWSGDRSGARVNRLLDAAGWPAADRAVDTGAAVLQSAVLGGDVLSALQKVEETEQGRLFMTADGKVRFIARDQLLLASLTSSATFGDGPTA